MSLSQCGQTDPPIQRSVAVSPAHPCPLWIKSLGFLEGTFLADTDTDRGSTDRKTCAPHSLRGHAEVRSRRLTSKRLVIGGSMVLTCVGATWATRPPALPPLTGMTTPTAGPGIYTTLSLACHPSMVWLTVLDHHHHHHSLSSVPVTSPAPRTGSSEPRAWITSSSLMQGSPISNLLFQGFSITLFSI